MPKGIGYGPKAKKRAAKRSAKATNKKAGQATSKMYGKTVQKDVGGGRTIGYATVAKTKLPKSGTRKVGKGASSQAKRSSRKARK
jgi:hypothetical protein